MRFPRRPSTCQASGRIVGVRSICRVHCRLPHGWWLAMTASVPIATNGLTVIQYGTVGSLCNWSARSSRTKDSHQSIPMVRSYFKSRSLLISWTCTMYPKAVIYNRSLDSIFESMKNSPFASEITHLLDKILTGLSL